MRVRSRGTGPRATVDEACAHHSVGQDRQILRRSGSGDPELQRWALVHSLRDAEILIRSHVPRDCVEQRFEVFAESGSNYARRNNDEPI